MNRNQLLSSPPERGLTSQTKRKRRLIAYFHIRKNHLMTEAPS